MLPGHTPGGVCGGTWHAIAAPGAARCRTPSLSSVGWGARRRRAAVAHWLVVPCGGDGPGNGISALHSLAKAVSGQPCGGGSTAQGRAWSEAPLCKEHHMSNDEVAVCTRRRLRCADPKGRGRLQCGHRTTGRAPRTCTHHAGVPDMTTHEMCCEGGPGWVSRHDNLRDYWTQGTNLGVIMSRERLRFRHGAAPKPMVASEEPS